ncbi:MAG: PAS domain S-box protein [Candidatus Aminicenantes bacterium]|nr:PAS domain S-box protein [Candidatus Aminicenantes bacterium]
MPDATDNRVLSQLLLLQSTLNSMPTDESISRFVVRGLKSVPGVRSLNMCVRGAVAEKNDLCASCNYRWGEAEDNFDYPCKLKDYGNTKCFPIRTIDRLYGFVVFSLNDIPDSFTPYEPYLWNIVNVIAISIDNKQQRQAMEAFNKQLQGEVELRMQMSEALRREKYFAESLVQTAQTIVLVLDTTGRIVSFNPYMEKISGYRLKEAQGKDWFSLFVPEHVRNRTRELFLKAIANTPTQGNVNEIVTKDGREIDIEWYDKILMNEEGNVIGLLAIGQDITGRKRAEDKIKALLREKELLLKEVHHRVKNNMSSMMSLLSMQSNALKNPEAVAALLEARNRMRSMGVLYDKLYRSENLREMSIKDYLPPLVDEIVGVFPNRGMVKIEKRIDDIVLGVKVLSPLGIIVNELITNAMKHAFTGRKDGLINVSASAKDNRVTLIIEDNGNGIPESVDIENSSGFGLQLVGLLTAQFDGTIRIERRKGTRIVLEFDM